LVARLATFAVFFAAALRATDFLDDAFDAALFAPARLFNAVLKAEEGVNFTPFDAAILTGTPVRGLRPVRAARAVGVNVPNPKIDTLLPPLVSDFTALMKASTALSARRLSSPVAPATDSTSSLRFTATSWRAWGSSCNKRCFQRTGQAPSAIFTRSDLPVERETVDLQRFLHDSPCGWKL
jgi:hypothetical protein